MAASANVVVKDIKDNKDTEKTTGKINGEVPGEVTSKEVDVKTGIEKETEVKTKTDDKTIAETLQTGIHFISKAAQALDRKYYQNKQLALELFAQFETDKNLRATQGAQPKKLSSKGKQNINDASENEIDLKDIYDRFPQLKSYSLEKYPALQNLIFDAVFNDDKEYVESRMALKSLNPKKDVGPLEPLLFLAIRQRNIECLHNLIHMNVNVNVVGTIASENAVDPHIFFGSPLLYVIHTLDPLYIPKNVVEMVEAKEKTITSKNESSASLASLMFSMVVTLIEAGDCPTREFHDGRHCMRTTFIHRLIELGASSDLVHPIIEYIIPKITNMNVKDYHNLSPIASLMTKLEHPTIKLNYAYIVIKILTAAPNQNYFQFTERANQRDDGMQCLLNIMMSVQNTLFLNGLDVKEKTTGEDFVRSILHNDILNMLFEKMALWALNITGIPGANILEAGQLVSEIFNPTPEKHRLADISIRQEGNESTVKRLNIVKQDFENVQVRAKINQEDLQQKIVQRATEIAKQNYLVGIYFSSKFPKEILNIIQNYWDIGCQRFVQQAFEYCTQVFKPGEETQFLENYTPDKIYDILQSTIIINENFDFDTFNEARNFDLLSKPNTTAWLQDRAPTVSVPNARFFDCASSFSLEENQSLVSDRKSQMDLCFRFSLARKQSSSEAKHSIETMFIHIYGNKNRVVQLVGQNREPLPMLFLHQLSTKSKGRRIMITPKLEFVQFFGQYSRTGSLKDALFEEVSLSSLNGDDADGRSMKPKNQNFNKS